MYFLDNLKNRFDFFIRSHIGISRKNYNEKPEDLSKIFNQRQQIIYNTLDNTYDLGLLQNSAKRVFLENIYFLKIFDRCFSTGKNDNLSILDIGSKNWSYVKSEYLFFNSFKKDFILNGIELDSNRLNSNFYSRAEIAKFYSKGLKNTNYISGDLMEHKERYDYIIWILPFILEYPLIKWGLPMKYFKPEKMLLHAFNLLNKGGQMLIINQGQEEYKVQKELNTKLGLNFEYFGLIEDDFNLFKNKRYCCKLIK